MRRWPVAMVIESERRRVFGMTPDDLWAVLDGVERYQDWWPWLRRFEAQALVVDATWRCMVRAPLGYPVRFELALDRVDAPSLVTATVSGDIVGDASVRLEHHPDGCLLGFRSAVEPSAGHLRLLGRMAPWVARRGHDAVVDAALRQFAERAV